MLGLTYKAKLDMARNLVRTAIRRQLERSLGDGPITFESDASVVAEELLALLTGPSVAPALQILSAVHLGERGE